MGFPNKVNAQPSVATPGDFADANVRANVLAGPGALIASAARPPVVGNFAWGDQLTGYALGRFYGELSAKLGFLSRQQGVTLIAAFLDERRLSVMAGNMTTLFDQGSFWAEFLGTATVGQKVFARYLDGSVYAAATGTTTQTASAMTGSIAVTTGILTVSALTGTLSVGDVLSGGVVPAGTSILSQLSGTAGGVGTYQTSTTVAAANLTGAVANNAVETSFSVDSPVAADASFTGVISAAGVLTVSALTGVMVVDQFVNATGLSPNARIVSQLTGSAGAAGTYQLNITQGPALTSRAMTASQGQLAKISTWS